MSSIVLGTVLGGALINPHVSAFLVGLIHFAEATPAIAALTVIMLVYILAALFNLRIPDPGARYAKQSFNPAALLKSFYHSFTTLWHDKLGQISLAVTTLFWGAGATLQFIVLKWAQHALGLPLDKAAFLQGIVAGRHCHRRRLGSQIHQTEKFPQGHETRRGHGHRRHGHDDGTFRLARLSASRPCRRPRRILRRADECPPPASGSCTSVCR